MINLLLAIHNHQPVGNFGHVFSKAFKDCYWPILEILSEFPEIKISIHHSGPLLDWAKKHEPNYMPTLVSLIKKGQVEPLGGGYYEPILAVIPSRDAAGQIKMMKDFWKAEAGIEPKGIWTTERIWEPSLAGLLHDNNVEYTILDDEHFKAAGLTDQTFYNYYLTERHGKTVSVFPSDQGLRYRIPFNLAEDVINHLLSMSHLNTCITYGDDGEKFGVWPGTHEWVIQKGWLKKFFSLLTENKDKIACRTIGDYHSKNEPSGTVYLPTCSYHEMGEWAMPVQAIRKYEGVVNFLKQSGKWEEAKTFVRGGYWDNFFSKYPESNYMHKKMIHVSEKVNKLKGEGEKEKNARLALYRGQCNCAYWHGLFGGLYLNYLRNTVFQNLIEAENIADEIDGKLSGPRIEKVDIDRDHSDELIISNKHIYAVVKPKKGAGLLEFTHRKSNLNLQDVLSRREEAYHKPDLNSMESHSHTDGVPSIHNMDKKLPDKSLLSYDVCRRLSFCDHVWPHTMGLSSIDHLKGEEHKALCNLSYKINSISENVAVLSAKTDWIEIQKIFTLEDPSKLSVSYKIKWPNGLKDPIKLGTALNLTLLAGNHEQRYYLRHDGETQAMDTRAEDKDIDELTLVDEYFNFKLKITTDKKKELWRYPVLTVSQSESGFDLLYQGSCIVWNSVVPANTKELEYNIGLEFI